ncbi:MAG: DsbE family thiol:disulfide interchange protein [Kiloniellaceae bacterium]
MSDGAMQATHDEPEDTIHAPHGEDRKAGGTRRRLIYALPTLIFAIVAGYFLWGLDPERDPREIPSVLIGKPVPNFDLPPVEGRTLGLSTSDLKGEVSLVNVFASWCTECRREHPVFMSLKENNIVPIHGLNYKDKPKDAREWLEELGDPYTRTGADISGRVGIEFGVYGVPETFVIDKAGMIAYKHIGAVTPRVLREKILPLIKDLRKATP